VTGACTTGVHEERLGLRSGVCSAVTSTGELRLYGPGIAEGLGRADSGKQAVLARLAAGPVAPDELDALHDAEGGDIGARTLLEQLSRGGWLTREVRWSDRNLYTVRPVAAVGPPPDTAPGDLVLSRFALLHREDDRFVLTSPTACGEIELHDPDLLVLLDALTRTVPAGGRPGPLPADVTAQALRDLQATGLAVRTPSAEDDGPELRQWRPHELWMHVRSRFRGRARPGEGFGRTGWGRDRFPPLPAVRPPFPGDGVDLVRPDLQELRAHDPPLTAVLEDRRSIRTFDDHRPLTVDQLGELLYRAAGRRGPAQILGPAEHSSRPYPAGGSAYEIELYPVVRTVAGLSPGLYHYDPHGHRLELVRPDDLQVRKLLVAAARSAAVDTPPQVLLVLAARFGRLMPVYEQISYSLVLRNVGSLYQTLYLVATAMGLAPCALGIGDPAAFAAATGLSPLVEGSVGEFALGSRAGDR
jgi:SagB-type dehydrogenase family enzyme